MTHSHTHWAALFAQSPDDYRVWGRFDNQPSTSGIPQWMLVMGATALLLASIALVNGLLTRRKRREFWQDNSSRLFRDLCRTHRLDSANRRLLKKLAAARGIEHTAELFVEPTHFEVADLPPALHASARDLRQLRHTLFQ
jgi:hypothetical protein